MLKSMISALSELSALWYDCHKSWKEDWIDTSVFFNLSFLGWTNQRGGLALVQQSSRQGEMRRSWYVVADGNWRHLYLPQTFSSWCRNPSWHADAADVRHLASYSRRESISHNFSFSICDGNGVFNLPGRRIERQRRYRGLVFEKALAGYGQDHLRCARPFPGYLLSAFSRILFHRWRRHPSQWRLLPNNGPDGWRHQC